MANKASLMKMIQEVSGYASVTNRRPAPRPPMLYLMQLREQQQQQQTPRQRVAISTNWQNASEVPLPIKIRHAKRGTTELPVVIG